MPVVTERQDKQLPARRPGRDERAGGQRSSQPARRRGRRRLAPAIASSLSTLIGAADIAGQMAPGLPERYQQLARGLHKASAMVPGGLATAAHIAGIITGLLLLMLSHGLRRRKHRAWQAVTALLAASAALDLLH